MAATSLYFHIPFCNRRCGYCDFNTFAGMKTHIPQYVKALCQEVKITAESAPETIPVGTLFFGGGTPSLLSVEQLRSVLDTTRNHFALDKEAEITLEANPGTVSREYLAGLKEIGFNRISFGMQSANVDDLRILNRQHHHEDVIQAVAWSRQAGFRHINLDLIFGIPGQSLQRWQQTLDMSLLERVDHFSLYSLIVEEGTPFHYWVNRGLIQPPDDDLAAEMYETAMRVLDEAGYEQYEISNWALKSDENAHCRHNLQYWRGLPYLGFGAGAHGFYGDMRTENVGTIDEYIRLVNEARSMHFPTGPASISSIRLSDWERMQEYLMVGFRLTKEGISATEFERRFGYSMQVLFEKQLHYLLENKLIEFSPDNSDRLRLTKRGILLGNKVFEQFVGNKKPAVLETKP